jgi:hypothetical protein
VYGPRSLQNHSHCPLHARFPPRNRSSRRPVLHPALLTWCASRTTDFSSLDCALMSDWWCLQLQSTPKKSASAARSVDAPASAAGASADLKPPEGVALISLAPPHTHTPVPRPPSAHYFRMARLHTVRTPVPARQRTALLGFGSRAPPPQPPPSATPPPTLLVPKTSPPKPIRALSARSATSSEPQHRPEFSRTAPLPVSAVVQPPVELETGAQTERVRSH